MAYRLPEESDGTGGEKCPHIYLVDDWLGPTTTVA